MNKSDTKLTELKKLFTDGHELSVYDIEQKLNIKRSRASSYLKDLKDAGLICKSCLKNKIAYYKLASDYSDDTIFSKIKTNDFYRYLIIVNLNWPKSRTALYNDIFSDSDLSTLLPLSSFYNLTNKMLEERVLAGISRSEKGINNDSSRLYDTLFIYPTGVSNSIILNIDTAEQAELNISVAPGMNQSDAIRSLYKKISMATNYTYDYEYDNSIYLQYGRGYSMDKEINRYYKLLLQNDFHEKVIRFDYKGKNTSFSTGMLVYSQDKDMLYLIGHKSGTRGSSKEVIKCSEISNISSTDEENTHFNSSDYIKYLHNMFSISSEDKPSEVEILFYNNPNIQRKLERLVKLRVNSDIEYTPNGILYSDIVSGLPDFANFLRGFGYKYEVIKPLSLKKMLHESIVKTMDTYS